MLALFSLAPSLSHRTRSFRHGSVPRCKALPRQSGTSLIEALLLMLLTALVVTSQQQLLAHASTTFQLAEAKRFATSAQHYLAMPQFRYLQCETHTACDWPWPLPKQLQLTELRDAPVCWQYAVEQFCLETR